MIFEKEVCRYRELEEGLKINGRIFIYISEWILLLVAVFYNLTFQLVFLGNIVLVDEGEEAAVFPYSYSFIMVVLGILFYFYIKHLQGSRMYRKVKEIIWGLFFAATAVSSLFWFLVNIAIFSQELLRNLILLAAIFLVSTLLAAQVAIKFKREGSGTN
jgi:hypothetical protein